MENRKRERDDKGKLFIGGLFWLLFLSSYAVAHADNGSFTCQSELYNDMEFSQPVNSFTVFDKVYLKLICSGLPAGSYTVVSDWINPLGKVTRRNNHTFEVKKETDYMTYSWMKLLRKGPFQRNFTGHDVDPENYGMWTVKAYLRGREVAAEQFTLQ